MNDALRLFLGVRVSMTTVGRLVEAQGALAKLATEAGHGIRWVSPASYHITLQFLGWGRPEVVEVLRDRVGKALVGQRAFEITAHGLGAFPKPEQAQVLWAGVDDSGGGLGKLVSKLANATADLGFPADKRGFHPHVTLGRSKKVADVAELLVPYAEQSFSGTFVKSVELFESVVKSGTLSYVERASWPLEAASNRPKRQTEGLDPGLTNNESD